MAYKKFTEEEKAAYKEKKAAEINQMFEQIENGISDVFTSDTYKNYLDFCSNFHKYSTNNNLLIKLQNPDATMVASGKKWRELGREVNKDEYKNGIAILAPVFVAKTQTEQRQAKDEYGNPIFNEDGTEKMEKVSVKSADEQVLRFKRVYVFDVSQTSGEPLPELIKPLIGDVNYETKATVVDVLRKATGTDFVFQPDNGHEYGHYNHETNQIFLNDNLSDLDFVSTYIHEAAHCLMHSKGNEKLAKEDKEIQAESVAYIVSQHLGLDTSEQSFAYIASWAANKDTSELKEILKETQKTADNLITQFDKAFEELRKKQAERQEIENSDDLHTALGLKDSSVNFYVVTVSTDYDDYEFVTNVYPDEENINEIPEFEKIVKEDGRENVNVSFTYYNVGMGESYDASEKDLEYIRNHLQAVIAESDIVDSESFTYKSELVRDDEIKENLKKAFEEKDNEMLNNVIEFDDDELAVLSADKIRIRDFGGEVEFIWTYYNADGNNGLGQFVDMYIIEDNLINANKERREAIKEKGMEYGSEAFINCIYQEAHTFICDNDGSDNFKKALDDFKNGEYSFTIEGYDQRSNEFYDKLLNFFSENCPRLSSALRTERLNGFQPVTTDMAITMWESGLCVTDNEGYPLAPFRQKPDDYGMFENVKDYTFYADSNDYYKQEIMDEICENVQNICEYPEFDLVKRCEDYEWYSYAEYWDEYMNTQELLRNGETEPIERFFADVRQESKNNPCLIDAYHFAATGQQAVNDLHKENERRQEQEQKQDNQKEVAVTKPQSGGRGR